MAATMGKDGGIYRGSTLIAFMDSWTLNTTINISDTTQYGNTTKVNTQTLKEWTIEGSGTLDRSDAQQSALLGQFESGTLGAEVVRCYTGASTYWAGSGVLTSGSVGSTVGDKVTVSFSWTCAGPLSYT